MKKVLISGILVLGSLVSLGQTAKIQEKVKPITKEEILKLNSDSVETTSVVDVRKF